MDEELDFELDRLQQSKWEQLKSAARLALEHRRRVKEGDFSVFLMPLAFAIAKDAIFDFIPVLGWLFGFFVTVYLFIFLFGRGKWKVRLVVFILSCFDSVPFVNLLPFQTMCVMYAYHVAKKDADRSKAALESLSKATPKIADDLRGVARQRALAAEKQGAIDQAANLQATENAPADVSSRERAARAPRMSGFSNRELTKNQPLPPPRVSGTLTQPSMQRKLVDASNDQSYKRVGQTPPDAAIARSRLSRTATSAHPEVFQQGKVSNERLPRAA